MSAETKIVVGLVGIGKIARDQHLPAIAANGDYRLRAAASRHAHPADLEVHRDIETLLARAAEIEAVILCTPPRVATG
jgi:predicted dehydrogenase